MRLRVGDIVAENYNLYWRFSRNSFIYLNEEADPSDGPARQIIGIIISVHKRFPDAFFDIPYYVYKVKWLNSPQGVVWDDKYFYEDELELLSRVNQDDDNDPEFEIEMTFESKEEE